MKCVSTIGLSLVFLISTGFAQRISSAHTEDVLRFAAAFLPKDPVIVEAGGYNGDDSVRIARFWPLGKLFSFEPVPEHFHEVYKKSRSCPNMTCFQKALSDRNGVATFYLSEQSGKVVGSSSLLPPTGHLTCDPSILFPAVLEVETITLDDWARQQGIGKVNFLWLDMQGYELNMLKASKLVLDADVIYTEVAFIELYEGQYLYEDIISWMNANGFRLAATDFDDTQIPTEIAENRPGANALFVKNRL